MVSGSAFLSFDLVGPLAGFLFGPLPEIVHLLLGAWLIFLGFVFVHRDHSAGRLVRVVRQQAEPTPVVHQTGDTD